MQFNDTRIIEYLTHQRRLFPALATTYAMHLSTDALKVHPYGTFMSKTANFLVLDLLVSHEVRLESLRHLFLGTISNIVGKNLGKRIIHGQSRTSQSFLIEINTMV